MLLKRTFFFLFFLVAATLLKAQTQEPPVAIGSWKAYLPYGGPDVIALAGQKVYAATGLSVFNLNLQDNSLERLHKANGLDDINAIGVYYGKETGTVAISYLNSNMDFIIDGELVNFPYIRTAGISGNKSINQVQFSGDTAFIATGFGIVVYQISEKESPATWFFTDADGAYINVRSVLTQDDQIFAATDVGLYVAGKDEPLLEDFSRWTLLSGTTLPTGSAGWLTPWNDLVTVTINDEDIYLFDGTDWSLYYAEADWQVRTCRSAGNGLQVLLIQGDEEIPEDYRMVDIADDGSVSELNTEGRFTAPNDFIRDADGAYWVADGFGLLTEISNDEYRSYLPNGPGSSSVAEMEYYDGRLWVAPGSINASWNYTYNRDGFFVLDYGFWNNYNQYDLPALTDVFDFITMTLDAATGIAWLGSFGSGVFSFDKATGMLTRYDQTNTGDMGLQDLGAADPGSCRIGGMIFDTEGNLWVSNYAASNPLVVRKADGSWMHFDCNLPLETGEQVGQIILDDFNQKWVQLPRGNGILVFDHGADIDNTADDMSRVLGVGAGNGNLPVAYVNCLVKDLDGEIWAGTNEGVSIFYNPASVMDGGTIADAAQPLVNLGGYNEYLLSKEIVNCITVDGANRKWIGTNSGVFLISADGTEQLLFFNQDNSPLLSNVVLSIAIDGVTGEVYFGTDKGIVSYRGTATQGLAEQGNVKVFPNPVRPEHNGPIAISGLVNNAQVKITDTGGRLIYETIALGGQAIWNGKGYNGQDAATGVYMVYSADDTGKETVVTRIVLLR